MPSKFTFITPFFQRHGIGFLDVILKALNDAPTKIVNNENERHDQYEVFKAIQSNGKLSNLEKVIYLLPKDYKNHIGAVPLWKEFSSKTKLDFIKSSIKKTSTNTKQSVEDLDKLINYIEDNENKTFPDYCWLEKHWRNPKDLWHIINEFSLATQVEWYQQHSTLFKENSSKKFKFVELDIEYSQLEEDKVTYALKKWLEDESIKTNTYINLWGVASSFQLAFHYLSWSSPRLKQSSFIKCTTVKTATDKERFTPLHIISTDKNLLATFESEKNKGTKLSAEQLDTSAWLKKYKEFDDNFTIMLLGPKGIGKTEIVNEVYDPKGTKKEVVSVNCAQFKSNPELACSELFGHKKGSFTGANSDKNGAFTKANDKVLFLDEVHHLDEATQAMLLTALQTDSNGFYNFTPLGGNDLEQSKFQLIVASNKKQGELKEFLLHDLLDRITQRVLRFSSLKPGKSIIKEFNNVWVDMAFMGSPNPVNPLLDESNDHFDLRFKTWLSHRSRKFEGNYRDLQKIAILSADYQRCKSDSRLIKGGVTLVDYIEQNWKQASKKKEISIENFLNENNQVSLESITNEFKAKIVRSAEYFNGDQKSAANMLGITPKSLIAIKKRDE